MADFFKAENLTVKAGSKTITCGVSVSVSRGETAVLIGESGCGKSVTAAALAGLLPSSLKVASGVITGGGRGRVGMIMQNPASCFDPVFTIRDHFEETFKAAGGGKPSESFLKELIFTVGLDASGVLEAYPFQLSGGTLQRLMTAMAIAMDTSFIIADEPSSDLDVLGQKELLELIKKVKKERDLGILFITHDLALASRAADNIFVMKDGKIIEKGSPEIILKNPSSDYAKALVKANSALYDTPWTDFRKEAAGEDTAGM